jgi:hypothetical protein
LSNFDSCLNVISMISRIRLYLDFDTRHTCLCLTIKTVAISTFILHFDKEQMKLYLWRQHCEYIIQRETYFGREKSIMFGIQSTSHMKQIPNLIQNYFPQKETIFTHICHKTRLLMVTGGQTRALNVFHSVRLYNWFLHNILIAVLNVQFELIKRPQSHRYAITFCYKYADLENLSPSGSFDPTPRAPEGGINLCLPCLKSASYQIR